jgi:hypothetical protein
MSKIYVGIDNGVSGSVGIIGVDGTPNFYLTPVKKELNYTKAKKWINRLDHEELRKILTLHLASMTPGGLLPAVALLERPMVNPQRFQATVSAVRCLESLLILLESMRIPFIYVDSKQWQKVMLPSGLPTEELKPASLSVGKRLFPMLEEKFKLDADSILMAEWARRNQL